MRRFLRFAVHVAVTGLFLSLSLVWSGPAVAQTAPETLADARPVQAGEVPTDFPIDYVGVLWDVPVGQEHGAEPHGAEPHGAEPHGAVRFFEGGEWGPWTALIEDGVTLL